MKRGETPSSGVRSLWASGAIAFVVAAIAAAPAELAAIVAEDRAPLLEITKAKGSLWRGAFEDVVYGGVLVGDVDYSLDPLGLLIGQVVADVTSKDGALTASGRISASGSRVVLKDLTAVFSLAAIRQYTFYGAPYQGSARLEAKTLSLSRSGCAAEGASVSTSALDGLTRRWSGEAFPLAGDIKCVDGALQFALAGDGTDGSVRMNVAVATDFTYKMTLIAEPRRTEVAQTLRLFGFEGDGDALSYRAVGQLKGFSS